MIGFTRIVAVIRLVYPTDRFVHESIEFSLYCMLSDAWSYLIGTSANTELIQSD